MAANYACLLLVVTDYRRLIILLIASFNNCGFEETVATVLHLCPFSFILKLDQVAEY